MLALGDTNYDKFCYMGKSIDKRCAELGGERIADLVCADEATNLEEQVTLWKSEAISALHRLQASADTSTGIEEQSSDEAKEGCGDLLDAEESSKEDKCHMDGVLPSGILTLSGVKCALSLDVDLDSAPDSSLLPRARKAGDGSEVKILEGKAPSNVDKENEWSVENPFVASVNSARWLTPSSLESPVLDLCSKCSLEEWESSRDVVAMELNINGSDMNYLPGDAIAICAPNPPELVELVMNRLREHHGSSGDSGWVRPETVVRKQDGEELSLSELFTYRYDSFFSLQDIS